MTKGEPGMLHGMQTLVIQEANGDPSAVHSIASGLDYPGVGPQHAFLRDAGRAIYTTASDDETLEAFQLLCRTEGIIPALESSHALAQAMKVAAELGSEGLVIANLSGRGDKDVDYVAEVLAKRKA